MKKPTNKILARLGAVQEKSYSPPPNARESTGPSIDDLPLPPGKSWPILQPVAFHGVVGNYVRSLAPHSEADPAAVLVNTLVAFGNLVGRGPYFKVEGDRHRANLFAAIVGRSAKARKTTAWGRTREIFEVIDPEWIESRILSGLTSGEGLIRAVQDPEEGESHSDRRLLVLATEFGQVLTVLKREGNTLSAILREAWDGHTLQNARANDPMKATNPHISILAQITLQELESLLAMTSIFNGFANRFLWVCSKRVQLLPHGGIDFDVTPYADDLAARLHAARQVEQMYRTADADRLWEKMYVELSAERGGILDAVTSRADAQVLRLSMIYCLADGDGRINIDHLQAARALWDYCDASAAYIFGSAHQDPTAAKILELLRHAGQDGMTRSCIRDAFHRNVAATTIVNCLASLRDDGKIFACPDMSTGGRPAERWKLTQYREQ